ncbi:MAG: Lrp/AsnC family transcriptional regulator [Gammaproteobacteria bacterium]|nr:Lrp/AsnC family transcriptional regulator [Gammaproteobacteria bacterium]
MLDTIDRKILRRLHRDSRIANSDLAEAVGLSTSSCWRRVKALEDSGFIRAYTVVLDESRLGLTFNAVVHVQLTRHDPVNMQAFIEAIRDRDEVQECMATTGQADYHLTVTCRDLSAYNDFLENFLLRMPAVSSAQTNLILKKIKSRDEALCL